MKAMPLAYALAGVAAFGAGNALVEGNPNSPVRVVIYEDLQCSDCANFRAMLDKQILPKYGARAAFEHRDFPLAKHAWSRKAAIASRFFATVRPEVAVEWRRYALGNLADITAGNFDAKLSAFATAHGIDPAKTIAALDKKEFQDAVQADYEDGVARGIAHTPTVFVGDEPFIETFTFEEIAASLEKAVSGQ